MSVWWWCRKKIGLSFLLLSAVVIFINYQYCKVRAGVNGGKDLSEIRSISYASNRPERDDPSTTTSPRPLSRKYESTAPISSSSQQSLSYNAVEDDDCPANGGGFTLALSFHDQQTWAFGNLLSLQNWAASLNLTSSSRSSSLRISGSLCGGKRAAVSVRSTAECSL